MLRQVVRAVLHLSGGVDADDVLLRGVVQLDKPTLQPHHQHHYQYREQKREQTAAKAHSPHPNSSVS